MTFSERNLNGLVITNIESFQEGDAPPTGPEVMGRMFALTTPVEGGRRMKGVTYVEPAIKLVRRELTDIWKAKDMDYHKEVGNYH